MNLNLEQCCRDARSAALAAWDVIRPFYQGSFKVIQKEGEGPATEADIVADAAILKFLGERYPKKDFGFLSEEAEKGSERIGKEACWIIDPIDGTRDFIEGKTDFAVQVGLSGGGDAAGQHPLVGVVYMPVHGIIQMAYRGGGAWSENVATGKTERLAVTDCADRACMNLVVTRSHWGDRMKAVVEHLHPKNVTRKGSLGVKVCDVASGVADAYVNTARRQCKEWDTCAPHAILAEAGGRLSDLRGNPVRYNKEDYYIDYGLIATNGALQQTVVESLRSIELLWDQ